MSADTPDSPKQVEDVKTLFQSGAPYGVLAYPDGSRYFDDLIQIICQISTEGEEFTVLVNSLLSRRKGFCRFRFTHRDTTPLHKHNYTEFAYVAEGHLRQSICGREEVFNKGEICLIDRDARHGEYLCRENSVVVFLGIANSFFDQFLGTDGGGGGGMAASDFLWDLVVKRKTKYRFIRFVPQKKDSEIPLLFEHLLSELWNSRPGSIHIVLGIVERLLNLLPADYRLLISGNPRDAEREALFNELQRCLNRHYRDVSLRELSRIFGYNPDYLNRLIRRRTGKTYTRFLQDIRLERAEYLLRTSQFPIEHISRQVGYENTGYFYKLFFNKYRLTPNDFRNRKKSE
jgi:AraC-like DNA-binding protein